MKKLLSVLAITALVSGCTTVNPYTGQTQTSKATWGTAIGAATGALIGSTQSSKGALIGGLAGAAVGGGAGYYLDAQAAELRAELVSTGVQVVESDDNTAFHGFVHTVQFHVARTWPPVSVLGIHVHILRCNAVVGFHNIYREQTQVPF